MSDFILFNMKYVVPIIVVIVSLILLKIANTIIASLMDKIAKTHTEYQKQISTVKHVTRSTIVGITSLLLLLYLLHTFGINIKPILATAGVAGVAIGLGAKRFIEDFIMGCSMIFEGQIRVGDYVKINSIEGTVEKLSLKMIILRDINGHMHFIRNGLINEIENQTTNYAYSIIWMGIAPDTHVDEAVEILKLTTEKIKNDKNFSSKILAEPEILGVECIKHNVTYIKSQIKTTAAAQWSVKNQFHELLREEFLSRNLRLISTQPD